MKQLSSNLKIAVIGLGYVGLPLAVEFSKNITLLVMILMNLELKNYIPELIEHLS